MPPAFEVLLLNTAIPQIQAAQSGDTYVVPRDIAFSAALTLSAGTANGVPYLNASKVLTTGSALTFDGTNLSSTGGATFQGGPTGYGGGEVRLGTAASGQTSAISTLAVDSPVLFFDHRGSGNTGVFAWRNGTGSSNELMRLTSTGLEVKGKLAVGYSDFSGLNANGAAFANNVGIGTDAPAARLDVRNGVAGEFVAVNALNTLYDAATAASSTIRLGITNSAGVSYATIKAAETGNDDYPSLVFGVQAAVTTNPTERARISSDGTFRVKGAGTAGSTDAFQVAGAAPADAARITSGGDLLVKKTSSGGSATGIDLNANGFVGSYSPDTSDATVTYAAYSNGASAYRFYVGWGGTVFATNTTISAISDQRFKENIRDLDIGLNAILALKPRKFDWKIGKGKDKKDDRGFIAQEFEQVFPDLIDTWKDPAPEGEEPYKSVRQDLIPVLVKAIQEQQAMINELKTEVAALKGA